MTDRYTQLRQEVLDWQFKYQQEKNPQAMKLAEEVGELLGAILKQAPTQKIADEVGDVMIVLLILGAFHLGIDPVEAALNKIAVVKQRKGKVVNGIFRKAEDAPACR